MRKPTWLVGSCVVVLGAFLVSAAWSELPPKKEFVPVGSRDPMVNPSLPMVLSASGDTVWVNAHLTNECPGSSYRGGEATGGPDGRETWCFEGGAGDTTSDGRPSGYVFRSYDRRVLRDDVDSLYWHADTFNAISGRSMWCGGFNDRCGSWSLATGGYGNYWQQIMQLTLTGPFNATNGCSLQFKTRYATECLYDYAYLEFWSPKHSTWQVLDNFNGKSGCVLAPAQPMCTPDWNNYRAPSGCPAQAFGTAVNYPSNWTSASGRDYPGYPYVNSNAFVLIPGDSISVMPSSIPEIKVRWRFAADTGGSTADGMAAVHGFFVDDVVFKVATFTHTQNFDTVPVGGLPGPPYSFPSLDPIYDGWALRYDLDPPLEGFFHPSPGDSGLPSACDVNASWQWSITPNGAFIPPPDPTLQIPGYHILFTSAAIPLNYGDEEGGPFASTGTVVQYDEFQNMLEVTCDYTDTRVRVHKAVGTGPWAATGAWCSWNDIDGFLTYGGGTFWNIDLNEDVTRWTSVSGSDSMQFGWASLDVGSPGDACWDPLLPPHLDTQFVVDNISVGLIDGSATVFTAGTRQGFFQDTFNLHTCMHSTNVANSDMGYGRYLLQDKSESLQYSVTDPNGLTPGNVLLHYSFDGFATEAPNSPKAMNLSEPAPTPGTGGLWRTTICDTPWTPGTEISYYITARDNSPTPATSYFPAASSPTSFPRTYLSVSILPTAGAKILFVDDYGRGSRFYHPCRLDTIIPATPLEDFYEDILRALGYEYMKAGGYDKYDVNDASSNQRINEPWGFWTADPDSPTVGQRTYDVVIWTTGPSFNVNTIQDTTQTFLKQFVFNGGKILITGDRIGQDLSQPTTATDPEFYDDLLGAEYLGIHGSGFLNSDRFPKVPTTPVGSTLTGSDSLHIYSGCDIPRQDMDKVRLHTTGLPPWSHPGIYLRYEDATADYDSVAGIYNFVTFTADTGKVIYLPYSLDALVDHWKVNCDPPASTPFVDVGYGRFNGRGELLKDILEIFGAPVRTGVETGAGAQFVNALYPAQPNPFNPEATVKFSLAARGQVRLAVYDVMGRRVRTLVDEVREAGPHAVLWNGRNESGHAVASGLYFARMEATGFTSTQKLTLLK